MSDAGDNLDHWRAELVAAARLGRFEAFLKDARRTLEDEGWKALVEHAIEAHRSGAIDLAGAFSAASEAKLSFAAQRFLEQTMPGLDVDLRQVLAVIAAVTIRAGDGGTPYYLLNAFGEYCDRDPERPRAALGAIRAGEAAADLLRPTLSSGLRVDRAKFLPLLPGMLATGTPDEQVAAADVLGRFEGFLASEQDVAVTALEAALDRTRGAQVSAPLRALLVIALRDPIRNPIGIRAIGAVASRSDAHVRETVAAELMFKSGKAGDALWQELVDLLLKTEAGEAATLDHIDQIISENLAGPRCAEAVALLDALLARGTATLEVLDSTCHSLLTGDAALRSARVARWLSSGQIGHLVAVRDLCMGCGGDALRFDLDFADKGLTGGDGERIARQACAVLMIFPDTIASILASLIRTGPADAIPAVERLLFDPLLINYWQGPRTYLESLLPAAPETLAASLSRAFARHDRYMAGVKAAGTIAELHPSQHHRFLARAKQHDEQVAIGRAAQSKSVFASIFPTSVLLYGDSAIFDMHIEPGKTRREETQLQSHEFSQELPRLDLIDPFGSWYQRQALLHGDDA